MAPRKLWGGRFTMPTNSALEELNASINLDKRMYFEDIEGSKAYARSLRLCNLLSLEECEKICSGLEKIKFEWMENQFKIQSGDEDIHTANERRLWELIGDAAGKLHVGRSRNDQVITDMRLWLKSALVTLERSLKSLINNMINRSITEVDVIMPGYTHLQRAQAVRWSHWLLSHAWNFKSDIDRLKQIYKRTNIMPLGSGALAGNPFCIDRIALAKDLGFADITQNSMQAVGDRDFVVEFLFWGSLTGIHLSRLAEDLILFSSKEFDFVEISDSYSTGSSLMPQKRNADSVELIRGIAGSLFGQCTSLMMTLKGLPSTYNKDLQNDKEAMFSAFDKLICTLEITNGLIDTLKVNSEKCRQALSVDMLATDLAYYLVRKGVPFRTAHQDAGRIVAIAENKKIKISDFTIQELQSINEHFKEDVIQIWNYECSIEQYQTKGGTSKISVMTQIDILTNWISLESTLSGKP